MNKRKSVPQETTTLEQTQMKLQESLDTWISLNTPPGARLAISFNEVRVVCDGRIAWRALDCEYEPGHSGQCYSETKHCFFTPERT